ncbi:MULTISPECIES: RNA methyltransferase [Thiomicrorhabdus]|uniref:tRNA (cytidine/uridine-2'-O-)-methyltransferase TrmJ n=1 Tax=Thiomicrorhabdus heinhorstiae TaxID=2748010 RepID=A0ABS0C3U7_9GAMM|nr:MULTISPECIES: RNA methyltransferase [Thiomicrorhabdus]MBF6058816.1 RNA methyltransferase [Thiomicrorhabdus heinhorstiae]
MIEDYTQNPLLANIRIVLIGTSHPGNIGSVARAMKNMGLSQLVLVKPRCDFPSQEASTRASSAADILNNAQVAENLPEAIKGTGLVVGASARLRKVSWPQLDVRETADLALKTAETTEVALVFGREDSGLSNEEMDLCHYLAHIPTNPTYSSLNLGAAVQVFAYECLMATQIESVHRKGYRHKLATTEQLEGFYDHLYQALQDIEFLDPAKNARFMRRMRRLFNRSQLDVKEIDILRGILTAAQRKAIGSQGDERV